MNSLCKYVINKIHHGNGVCFVSNLLYEQIFWTFVPPLHEIQPTTFCHAWLEAESSGVFTVHLAADKSISMLGGSLCFNKLVSGTVFR